MIQFHNFLLTTFFVSIIALPLQAQDEGFLYGKITTFDNQSYEGPIRWGKEEVYWIDLFNAEKIENQNLKYLSNDDKDKLHDSRFGKMDCNNFSFCFGRKRGNRTVYGWSNESYTHQFSLQFGEIKIISPKRNQRAELELQSGLKFEVNGMGYNDIGATISVLDKEIGEIGVDWNRIQKIEFKPTPSKLNQKFGEAIFATVETYQGQFKGILQWDKEERLGTDKLDGEMEDGKISIALEKIQGLERFHNRLKVNLQSGREMELSGTNDVNSENRGIVVVQENGVTVDIPWSEFKKATLGTGNKMILKKYSDFGKQKEIKATVASSKGKSQVGKTILDLDEEYDFELFQGKSNDIEYSLPFRTIKKLNVLENDRVEIELKNGEKLVLRESQDTGDGHQGVLVFDDASKAAYFPWSEVKEIEMQ
jgi:hypothetical protein